MHGSSLRDIVKTALRRLGLLGTARRVREAGEALSWVPHNRRFLQRGGGDGLPLPPVRIRMLLSHSVSQVDSAVADGLWTEFGVYSGKTINYIAEQTDHVVHGFDSFEGLPEDWRTGFPKGTFEMDGMMPRVRENVRLHKGWFDESVPVWAAAHPGHMAFIHFDADLYSSTKTVLDLLGNRIVAGTVIQFDEFFNYPGWQEGEYRAFMEFVEAHGVEFEYIGYCEKGNAEQVAVRITKMLRGLSTVRRRVEQLAG